MGSEVNLSRLEQEGKFSFVPKPTYLAPHNRVGMRGIRKNASDSFPGLLWIQGREGILLTTPFFQGAVEVLRSHLSLLFYKLNNSSSLIYSP